MKNELEKRVKLLEEEIMYIYKDIETLTILLEHIKPEVHYHYYYDLRTCKDKNNSQPDLNEFI